ncbi:serine hydrolase domain-containing protein [Proteinivorax tanatarense]|uniref:Serine hydrolase domain-containing protein n=1 Tax=Proteinivorax tanatarense TaxID=1260629 RepID=A0AAU7VNA7_9FIRM
MDMEKRIDLIFAKWQQGLCPGGQVVVRKDGQTIYNKNYGYASLEHSIPITRQTSFHVASVSKQITVMCVLLLEEDGKLSIDDDVREYVSEYIGFDEPVTLRQMINNVSGIRDQWELLGLSGVRIVDTITQKDALTLIRKQKKLNFEPETNWLYSNSNFTLLAEVVERVSGKTLNEFATERIFKPLGMGNTFFKDNYWELISNKANSYYDTGADGFVCSVLNYGTYGATALNTTADDFALWMDNFKKSTICTDSTIKTMLTPAKLKNGKESNYAGGLFVGEHKGHKYIEHGGADAAYRSAIVRFTEEDVDIIVFSNTQNIMMKDAAFSIANVIFGSGEKPKRKQGNYYKEIEVTDPDGFYFPTECEPIMALKIITKNGKLHLENPYGLSPLIPIAGNQFKVEHLNSELYFGKNSFLKTKEKTIPLTQLKPFTPLDSVQYEGKYQSDELDTFYNIVEKDKILYISHPRNGQQKLYQVEDNKFVISSTFTFIVEFIKNEGKITGLRFSGNRAKKIDFVRHEI